VPGEPVELRPEPRNPFDERAIAVFSCRGVQIGYLPAERCGRIGQLIRQGHELRAVFQAQAKFGAWVRIAFDGAQPILPSASQPEPAVGADQDWFPDEIWPDEQADSQGETWS